MQNSMFPVPKDAQSPGASSIQWFAGLAMQAIIAKQATVPDTVEEREEIALWAYRMGQTMVETEKQLHINRKSDA